MYWNKKSPAISSSRVNFYYKPSMAEVAAMLISSPGSFDFSYVDQIAKDQQYNLLKHFESIYDQHPKTRPIINEMLIDIPFSTGAKCEFVIHGERYKKFPGLIVDRVSTPYSIELLAKHHDDYPDEVDQILKNILVAKGQGTKIKTAVATTERLPLLFNSVIPDVLHNREINDPVTVARNISHTKAELSKHDYDALESMITMVVLSDDIRVRTNTAIKHMKNIKQAGLTSE